MESGECQREALEHVRHGMSLIAPAGPETFMRRPNPVQNLRGWTPARGTDAATKAPHPVRWSHNTRTALRRFRCGGRDRQKRDTAYPGDALIGFRGLMLQRCPRIVTHF